jgi:nucleotide-binding universal stress UspA family protein
VRDKLKLERESLEATLQRVERKAANPSRNIRSGCLKKQIVMALRSTIKVRKEETMIKIKKILVSTDFSAHSLAAVEYARVIATKFGAQILLVHVVDTVPVPGVTSLDPNNGKLARKMERKALKELKAFASEHLKGIRNLHLFLCTGPPYDEIVRLATNEGVGLVVISTHGRTGLAHVIIGSVAERVVRHSPIPVLTVKPQGMHEASASSSMK